MAISEDFTEDSVGETAPRELKVSPDQEVWLLSRLTELVEVVQSIQRLRNTFVGASELMVTGALEGAINGTAIEIIHTLGLYPSFINIKPQPFNIHDRINAAHISSSNQAINWNVRL